MYNGNASQNNNQADFHILPLMGGCARIPFGVLGSHDRPFKLEEI